MKKENGIAKFEHTPKNLTEALTEKFCRRIYFYKEKNEQLEKILNEYAEEYLKKGLGNAKEFKEILLETLILKLKTEKYKNNENIKLDLKSCQ